MRRVAPGFPEAVGLVRLTARERLVLQQLAVHETMADVAAELTVSVNTIKKQTLSIYAKLGTHERAAALARAHDLGLL